MASIFPGKNSNIQISPKYPKSTFSMVMIFFLLPSTTDAIKQLQEKWIAAKSNSIMQIVLLLCVFLGLSHRQSVPHWVGMMRSCVEESSQLFAPTVHSFTCSELLASLVRFAVLIRSLAYSLPSSWERGFFEMNAPTSYNIDPWCVYPLCPFFFGGIDVLLSTAWPVWARFFWKDLRSNLCKGKPDENCFFSAVSR